MIGLYSLTWALAKFKRMKLQNHRKLWNVLLLSSFLVSGILGVLLAVLLDLNISIAWYKVYLWLHVEFGIVMGVIAMFHFAWHSKYYLKILSGKNIINKEAPKEVFNKEASKEIFKKEIGINM
jgi:hypothetical protein